MQTSFHRALSVVMLTLALVSSTLTANAVGENWSKVRGTTQIAASINGSGLTRVEFLVDGATERVLDPVNDIEFEFDFSDLDPGAHSIGIRATSASGTGQAEMDLVVLETEEPGRTLGLDVGNALCLGIAVGAVIVLIVIILIFRRRSRG